MVPTASNAYSLYEVFRDNVLGNVNPYCLFCYVFLKLGVAAKLTSECSPAAHNDDRQQLQPEQVTRRGLKTKNVLADGWGLDPTKSTNCARGPALPEPVKYYDVSLDGIGVPT